MFGKSLRWLGPATLLLAVSLAGAHADSTIEGVDVSGVTLKVGTAGPRFKASWDFSAPDVPYTVEFAPFDGAAPIVEALTAGGVDIGLPGDIGVIFALAAGAELEIVGVQAGNPDFVRLIVPSGSDATTLEDLKGRSIAVARGTLSHMVMLRTVAEAGLDPSEFNWVYLSNPDAGTAFQRGDVDAWATWDPFAATAEVRWGARLIVAANENTIGDTYWVAKPGFFADNSPKAVAARDLIARFAEVNRAELEQKEAWTEALARALRLDDDVAAQTADHYYWVSVPLTDRTVDNFEFSTRLLADQGLIPAPLEGRAYFNLDAVNAAVEAAIGKLGQ